MTDPEGTVPMWAVSLRETVARIDERTNQIPTVIVQLDELRRTSVPHSEHELLMARVDQLWTRDLGARHEWDEMVPRVRTLWTERSEVQGARRGYRLMLVILSGAVTFLTAFTLLHDLGFAVSVHP